MPPQCPLFVKRGYVTSPATHATVPQPSARGGEPPDRGGKRYRWAPNDHQAQRATHTVTSYVVVEVGHHQATTTTKTTNKNKTNDNNKQQRRQQTRQPTATTQTTTDDVGDPTPGKDDGQQQPVPIAMCWRQTGLQRLPIRADDGDDADVDDVGDPIPKAD